MTNRQWAHAIAAAIDPDAWVKVKEDTKACTTTRAVYGVWIRPIGAKRGKRIASIVYHIGGK